LILNLQLSFIDEKEINFLTEVIEILSGSLIFRFTVMIILPKLVMFQLNTWGAWFDGSEDIIWKVKTFLSTIKVMFDICIRGLENWICTLPYESIDLILIIRSALIVLFFPSKDAKSNRLFNYKKIGSGIIDIVVKTKAVLPLFINPEI
jgi:hypothetical protein